MTKRDTIPLHATGPLTAGQTRSLRALVGLMIPASEQFQVPGADDDTVFADIVATLGRDTATVRQALARLDELAGQPFADLPAAQQRQVAQQFRDEQSPLVSAVVAVTVRSYYRDDRVMRSIGMEPRPPFPKGYDVPAGDWTLLEPVRARGRIWRDAG